jgi:hypothetical protein
MSRPLPAASVDAVGWRVDVYWPEEKQWFTGVVVRAVNASKLKVLYGTWLPTW